MASDKSADVGAARGRLTFRSGLIEGMFGPGLGTFAAMAGFGSLAADAGTPLWAAVALTIGVWNMPGQVAFVELYASEATLLLFALIVTVASVRIFPITVATIPLLRKGLGVTPQHFILAQLNSVTSYVRLVDVAQTEHDVDSRIGFFTAFTLGTLVVGTIGTVLGFALAGLLPVAGVQALIFITPLYLLLLTARSPKVQVQLSVLTGCLLVPAFSVWMGSIGTLAGGLVAGSLAYIATAWRHRYA
jgi:predicted branched-subunit amino acid permease